jgi:tRNA modification GTPase
MSLEGQVTTAVKLTGTLAAAVGVISVTGPDACRSILKCWKSVSGKDNLVLNRIYYGQWIGPPDRLHEYCEDVVLCRVGDDEIEIHCHGGPAVLERILQDLQNTSNLKIETAARGQKHDRITQDALHDLQTARSINAVHLLLTQANGKLSKAIQDLVEEVSAPTRQKRERCEELICRGRVGLLVSQPPDIVILGPPNAGKSTLINRLLGWERAIVDPAPGTTRDVLREEISLEGWPLSIVDTAGLRQSSDEIELEGMAKALRLADRVACVLLLVDGTVGWTDKHQEVFEQFTTKTIPVLTKSDLVSSTLLQKSNFPAGTLVISALTGDGIAELTKTIVAKLGYDASLLNEAVPFRPQQLAALQAAQEQVHDPAAFKEYLLKLLHGMDN